MSKALTESTVEEAPLEWFEALGYTTLNGPDIAPGELFAERTSYCYVALLGRSPQTFAGINPKDGVHGTNAGLKPSGRALILGEVRAGVSEAKSGDNLRWLR